MSNSAAKDGQMNDCQKIFQMTVKKNIFFNNKNKIMGKEK